MTKEPLVIKRGTLFIIDWPNDMREIHHVLSEVPPISPDNKDIKVYNVATITMNPDKEYQKAFAPDDVFALNYFQDIWEDKVKNMGMNPLGKAEFVRPRERKKLANNCYYARMYTVNK